MDVKADSPSTVAKSASSGRPRAVEKRMPDSRLAEAFRIRLKANADVPVPPSPARQEIPPGDLDTDAEQESRGYVYDISAVDPDKWVCYGCKYNVQEQHAEV